MKQTVFTVNSITKSNSSILYSPLHKAEEMANKIQIIQNIDEVFALVARLSQPLRPTVLSFANAHAVNLLWNDESFADTLLDSHVVLRDGIGLSILFRAMGKTPGLNMNGTDFIPLMVEAYKGKSVALLGTCAPYLERAAYALTHKGAHVVLCMDGYQSDAAYAEQLSAAGADLVILGMGMPKQERVASLLAQTLTTPTLIINGGAIIDFWAERFQRAPRSWRALHLEWLYRLLQEPGRLYKRYLIGGAAFIAKTAAIGWHHAIHKSKH